MDNVNEPATDYDASELSIDTSKTWLGGIHHPWRRFFARTVDLMMVGVPIALLLMFLVVIFFPQTADGFAKVMENMILTGLFMYIVWIPTEAALIATTGTTPSKWILGISVLGIDGKKLPYADSLKRAFQVWVLGDGFGIPLIGIFTRFFGYRQLTKTGTTRWDTAVGSVVKHKKWGFFRATASLFYVSLALLIYSLLPSA